MTREEYLRRRAELVAEERRYKGKFWAALPLVCGLMLYGLMYSTFLTGAAYQRWKDAEQRLEDLESGRVIGPCEECSRQAAEAFKNK